MEAIIGDLTYRRHDDLFTIIRDPVDRALSMANYVTNTITDPSTEGREDSETWKDKLFSRQVDRKSNGPSPAEIAKIILHAPEINIPNGLCNSLGRSDYASSIDNIIRSDIEITDIDLYERWIGEKWNIDYSCKLNTSNKIITRDDLTDDDLSALEYNNLEDFKLYRHLRSAIERCGSSSIRGSSLDY